MRIGIDIDDTISNTTIAYENIVKKYCHDNKITRRKFNNNKKYINDCMKKYGKETISNITIKSNAKEVINKLKQNNEIVIITARNTQTFKDLFDFENITKEWLNKNGIKYDEYYGGVYGLGKALTCKNKNIDIMIDDDIKNYKSIKSLGIDVKLFDDKNKHRFLKDRVKNWEEIEKLLK